MEKYNHKSIERKWQERWQKEKLYKTSENKDKPKYYVLDMFPYPSGAGLHVGHPKGYIATDIFARAKMMQGFNVLHPMGWDAFGLPAENYAIANKIHPREATEKNIATFKGQLEKLGFTYDWEREINTTDPEYYKWTQWTFIKMFERGLAYESKEPVNWCPSCKTVLSNEDLENGKCERCGSEVERKPMRQWVLKITDYADRLLNDLEKLPDWEESIKEMQRNWIGRSEGAEVDFEINGEKVTVFTTRPDTLFGATFMVIAPEHHLVKEITTEEQKKEVEKYIKEASNKSDLERTELQKEKTGVFTGAYAINPVNQEKIPVYIADYVMMGYGTGAIMAVPAHDERDWEFAKNHKISIKFVVEPEFITVLNLCFKIFEKKFGKFNFKDIDHWYNLGDLIYFLKSFISERKLEIKNLELWQSEFEKWAFPFSWQTTKNNLPKPSREFIIQELVCWWSGYFEKNRNDSDKIKKAQEDDAPEEYVNLLFKKIEENSKKALNEEILNERIVSLIIKENIKLPISSEMINDFSDQLLVYEGEGININSSFLNGLTTDVAKRNTIAFLKMSSSGERAVNYKLRDWVFSRQRYWGEPIPIVHCEKCGSAGSPRAVAVPYDELPLKLPDVKNYEPTGTGESPLANIEKWVNTKCPKCGGSAKRETNTMPQWAGSSWYYLRYIDPHNKKALVDKEKEKYWSPVDFYVGGAEHATRHLIYARFWHKFLFDLGAVNYDEPFTRLQHVGLILAEDGRKMSKRWNNVINPDEIVEKFGADAMRVYEMFMGPFSQACAWSTNGLLGGRRFLENVYKLKDKKLYDCKGGDCKIKETGLPQLLHKTIKKVTEDIENFHYNTAISQMMIFVNFAGKLEAMPRGALENFLKLLAPFAPHLAEELWENIKSPPPPFVKGGGNSIFKQAWPKFNADLVKDEKINLVIQVNGKMRDMIEISADISEEEAKKVTLEREKIKKWLEGKEPKKIIFVKGKLVNIVIHPVK